MALRDIMLSGFGEGVTVATIIKWHVKAFDTVQEGQLVAEVMAGQTTVTVPSPKAGRILVTHGKEAEQVKVQQPLVTMIVEEAAPAQDTVYRTYVVGPSSFATQFGRLPGDRD